MPHKDLTSKHSYYQSLGFNLEGETEPTEADLIRYINIELISHGCPPYRGQFDENFFKITEPYFRNIREKRRLLANQYCPVDGRINSFLAKYFSDVKEFQGVKLPSESFVLGRHGIARTLSLSPEKNSYHSTYVDSFRIKQGVLHNPKSDRRTTKGVFHVVEGGFAIANDKIAVPKITFVRLLRQAMLPPRDDLRLPFTTGQEEEAELFVSLLLRPTISPEVPGWQERKSMEVRFFAPGALVGNLDFVESIFGNAGDPFMPENDSGLDAKHWSGHTGCVILAPHLIHLTKKELGLPTFEKATDRQKRDGMCWKDPAEKYNNGQAFKITCRDHRGVIVTIIADNYFGYCKKEVKTQISYAANLFGACEEEHAGGVLAFSSMDLGDEYVAAADRHHEHRTFSQVVKKYGDALQVHAEGYAVDRLYTNIVYVPENAEFHLDSGTVTWMKKNQKMAIPLKPKMAYVLPWGYRVAMKKSNDRDIWRLIGTHSEGTQCHKPCTVSGGGKSEISKPLDNMMMTGPIYLVDLEADFNLIEQIMANDFSNRFKNAKGTQKKSRDILSSERTLGSVIKLLTPSSDYTDDYNEWLNSIPAYIKTLLYAIKKQYKPKWRKNWRDHFMVDIVNGEPAHELKCGNKPLTSHYIRVGFDEDGSWRMFNTRYDFSASEKIQTEDDISASIVVPSQRLSSPNPNWDYPSVKIVENCEYRLFQRPDDAINPGQDKTAEADMARKGNFLSNYEPLPQSESQKIIDNVIQFEAYTPPMRELVQAVVAEAPDTFFGMSSHPRIVDGVPTKNPRYLQSRPDMIDPAPTHLAKMCVRLHRELPADEPVIFPIDSVIPGRRNNPPDPKQGVPALAVYNPIHYQELPELFMDFISSVTGKSPSTTGFGSEGALTKGPFNAILPAADLNNAFLSYVLTGYNGFSSGAGVLGPSFEVQHDISLLIPEIWCRMAQDEQEPAFLIKSGCLEPVADFTYQGRHIPASVLGYRMTLRFANLYFGRIFNSPNIVFTDEMLRPEMQNLALFVEGVESLMSTHKRVASGYLEDGTAEQLCPPLQALVHIMATGSYKKMTLNSPEFRALFTRDYVMASDWYRKRLLTFQRNEIALYQRHLKSLEAFRAKAIYGDLAEAMDINSRIQFAKTRLKLCKSAKYPTMLQGTLGAQVFG